jgi:hypothetical protein
MEIISRRACGGFNCGDSDGTAADSAAAMAASMGQRKGLKESNCSDKERKRKKKRDLFRRFILN